MVPTQPRRSGSSRRGRLVLALGISALVLALAACGSRLDPDDVLAVSGADGAVAADGTVPGTDGGTAVDGTTTGGGGSGDASTSGGAGASGDESSGGGGGGGGAGAPPVTGNPKADCSGFKNQTGVTDDKIVIASVADISGPVPGIFESAQEASRAFAAYFNASSDLCGRKLEVLALDSRADAGADQQAYTRACEDAFAGVGSMGAFDHGGAKTAQDCKLPDIRSTMTTPERRNCATCFAAQSVNPGAVPSVVYKWFFDNYKDATQKAAMLYINAGAAVTNGKAFAAAAEKNGWNELYVEGIDVSEFNYAPYVQEMKDLGVKLVQYVGPYQNSVKLQQAMQQGGLDPEVYLQDATIYDARYVEQAGELGNGSFVYMANQMFERTNIAEMALYQSWLQQVKPGATPTFFGLYAWSAARLFTQKAYELGGDLTRASLVAAMGKVDGWTANGLHSPTHVSTKETSGCQMIIQLNDGKWTQRSPGNGFMCGPLTRVSVD